MKIAHDLIQMVKLNFQIHAGSDYKKRSGVFSTGATGALAPEIFGQSITVSAL